MEGPRALSTATETKVRVKGDRSMTPQWPLGSRPCGARPSSRASAAGPAKRSGCGRGLPGAPLGALEKLLSLSEPLLACELGIRTVQASKRQDKGDSSSGIQRPPVGQGSVHVSHHFPLYEEISLHVASFTLNAVSDFISSLPASKSLARSHPAFRESVSTRPQLNQHWNVKISPFQALGCNHA